MSGSSLIWPALRKTATTWTLDLDITTVAWESATCIDDYLVHTTTAHSPMARYLQGLSEFASGPLLEVVETQPLLDWHANRGFPHITECVLERLCDHLDLEASHADVVEGQTYKHTLVLVLLARLLPDLTEAKALHIFLSLTQQEDEKGQNLLDYVDDQLVQDVVLLADQSTKKEFTEERTKVLQTRKAAVHTCKSLVQQCFGTSVGKAKAAKETAAAKRKSQQEQQQNSKRWLAALRDAPDECILKSAPPQLYLYSRCLQWALFVQAPRLHQEKLFLDSAWLTRSRQIGTHTNVAVAL